jgi:hypothetical protein
MENKIAVDSSHPFHPEFKLLPSGHRYRLPKVKKNRAKYSFIPNAILQLNKMLDSLHLALAL